MTLQTYDVGDTVQIDADFTDTGGSPAAPTSMRFVVRDPAGSESTYASASTSVTNDSTGSYYTRFVVDQAGTWRWRSDSTGSVVTASESAFVVRKQYVST